jgi:hypothetical protein
MSTENNENVNEELTAEQIAAQEAAEAAASEGGGEEAAKPYFAAFGYEDEDSFKSEFESLKELKSIKDQVEQNKWEYEERLGILMQVEEDPDPEIVTISTLKKQGIGINVATQVISADSESLEKDPLKALILAEAVTNPKIYNKLGREATEEAIREKYNLTSDGEYVPTAMMRRDALDAIEKIMSVKNGIGEAKNPYKIAAQERENKNKAFVERQGLAVNEVSTYVNSLKEVSYKFGDSEVSLQVSKEEVDSLLKSQSASVLGHLFDVSTKAGKEQLRDWATKQILAQKFQSGEVGQKIVESFGKEVKKEVIKEVHNGQPLRIDRSGKKSESGKELTAVQRDLIAQGKKPLSLGG